MFIAAGASRKMVQGQVEGVEVAPPASRRKVSRQPVRDQRNLLLGDSAVRAQRRIEARKVVPPGARADDGEPLGNDDEVADAILGKLEPRGGFRAWQHDIDSG